MATPRADFRDWMAAIQERVEAALARSLPAADHEPRRLHAAMRYAVLGAGKRVRPLLAFAAGAATGACAGAPRSWFTARAAALWPSFTWRRS